MKIFDSLLDRIFTDRQQLAEHLAGRHRGEKVVFTNGCFDLIHRGHISYLSRARELGDLLVLGLNSDASVRQLKGPTRPVNGELDRALHLVSLRFVDYVTIFSESTPEETIRILKPSIHTKGGDYDPEKLPERDAVLEGGGEIRILPFVEGYSTTSILSRVNSRREK